MRTVLMATEKGSEPFCAKHPAGLSGKRVPTPFLRRFLGAYWLRPENAFWMALRSEALAFVADPGQQAWATPSIDLSCGDGVFTFLHAGGVFDDDFDVFRDAAPLDDLHDEQADMFDHLGKHCSPAVVSPPAYRVDVGTDFKSNLLVKAGFLDLYGELVVHDNNRPLPFDTGAFRTVYCNAAYWVENIDGFLSEIRRITAGDGRVLLQVKLAAYWATPWSVTAACWATASWRSSTAAGRTLGPRWRIDRPGKRASPRPD